MARRQTSQRTHLRLVEPPAPDAPAIVTDPHARREFEQLTQSLVDIAIEIVDLVDGDPDLELSADDCEDGDDCI